MNIVQRNPKQTIKMSVDDFIRIPEFVGKGTAQRNTAFRGKKAQKGHLSSMGINHDEVRISIHPDGTWYRTDGNTRAYLWESNLLERPSELSVVVVTCSTLEDFDASYDQVDNIGQVKSKIDVVYGIMRALEFEPESPILANPKLSVALWTAQLSLQTAGQQKLDHGIDLKLAITEWLPELRLIDTLNIKSSKVWNSGMLAGALIALRASKDKGRTLNFFDLCQKNHFETKTLSRGVTVNAVYALRRQSPGGTNGWDKSETMAGYVLSAYDAWCRDKWYPNNANDVPKINPKSIQGVSRPYTRRSPKASIAA